MDFDLGWRLAEAESRNTMTPRILVLGDCMLDKFVRGEVKRISPEAPVAVLLAQSESFHLGGAANVAANARALGADVDLIGVVGKDEPANKFALFVRGNFVNWLGFSATDGRTTVKTRYCSSSHSGHHLLRVDKEGDPLQHSSVVESRLGEIEFKPYDAIIICDYLKGVVTQAVVDYVEKNFSKKVFFDGKPKSPTPPPRWAWKLNRIEADELFGIRFGVPQGGRDCFNAIANELVVTLGAHGISAYAGEGGYGECFRHPALCKSPVDVSGAGDTVMAAYAVARTQGKSIPEALEFASKAAAVAVSQPGTAVVRLEDIQ